MDENELNAYKFYGSKWLERQKEEGEGELKKRLYFAAIAVLVLLAGYIIFLNLFQHQSYESFKMSETVELKPPEFKSSGNAVNAVALVPGTGCPGVEIGYSKAACKQVETKNGIVKGYPTLARLETLKVYVQFGFYSGSAGQKKEVSKKSLEKFKEEYDELRRVAAVETWKLPEMEFTDNPEEATIMVKFLEKGAINSRYREVYGKELQAEGWAILGFGEYKGKIIAKHIIVVPYYELPAADEKAYTYQHELAHAVFGIESHPEGSLLASYKIPFFLDFDSETLKNIIKSKVIVSPLPKGIPLESNQLAIQIFKEWDKI